MGIRLIARYVAISFFISVPLLRILNFGLMLLPLHALRAKSMMRRIFFHAMSGSPPANFIDRFRILYFLHCSIALSTALSAIEMVILPLSLSIYQYEHLKLHEFV